MTRPRSADLIPYRSVRALAAALFLCVCGCVTLRSGPPSTLAVLRKATDGIPALRFDVFEEYRGERLFDYMNGAAVTYFEHDFRVMATCDVFEGENQAKIEFYEFAGSANAKTVFAEFAAGVGAEVLPAGEAGRYWPGLEPEFLFHRGPYFVRVIAYAVKEADGLALGKKLAVALDEGLK